MRGVIGSYLKAEREAKGLTRTAVADAAGITRCHLWQIERGECKEPGFWAIAGIAKALNISLDVLAYNDAGEGI